MIESFDQRITPLIRAIASTLFESMDLEPEITIRGMLLAGSSISSAVTGCDIDLCVLIEQPWVQRRRSDVQGSVADLFIHDEATILRAFRRKIDDHLVRMYATGIVVSDRDGSVAKLCKRAQRALQSSKPQLNSDELFGVVGPVLDLWHKYIKASDKVEKVMLLGNIVMAGLQARIRLANRWSVGIADLFPEVGQFDPGAAELARKLLESCPEGEEIEMFLRAALGDHFEMTDFVGSKQASRLINLVSTST